MSLKRVASNSSSFLILLATVVFYLGANTAVSFSQTLNFSHCKFRTFSIEAEMHGGSDQKKRSEFIDSTTSIIARLVAPETGLGEVGPGRADVSLRYIFDWTLYKTSDNKSPVLDYLAKFPVSKNSIKMLTSPWVRINLNKDCRLEIVLIYNTRQMIADQAFLAGVRPVRNGIITPKDDPEFDLMQFYKRKVTLLEDYSAEKKILEKNRVKNGWKKFFSQIEQLQDQAKATISDKFPPEMFWYMSQTISGNEYLESEIFDDGYYKRRYLKHSTTVLEQLITKLLQNFILSQSEKNIFDDVVQADEMFSLSDNKIDF